MAEIFTSGKLSVSLSETLLFAGERVLITLRSWSEPEGGVGGFRRQGVCELDPKGLEGGF